MTGLRNIYQNPQVISLSSQNGELILSTKNPLTLYNLNLTFFNPNIDATIEFYDLNGNLISAINQNNSFELNISNGEFSKIKWNDTYNYTVTGWIQEIIPQSEDQLNALLTDFNFNLVPVGNEVIVSPLDTNGNVRTTISNTYLTRLANLTNYSALVNTNIFSSNITSQYSGLVEFVIVTNTTSVCNLIYNGVTMALNGGNQLVANTGYNFSMHTVAGDTFNIQFATAGTVSVWIFNMVVE
jgi:hypothetical protein